jgi:hypothetical protein
MHKLANIAWTNVLLSANTGNDKSNVDFRSMRRGKDPRCLSILFSKGNPTKEEITFEKLPAIRDKNTIKIQPTFCSAKGSCIINLWSAFNKDSYLH